MHMIAQNNPLDRKIHSSRVCVILKTLMRSQIEQIIKKCFQNSLLTRLEWFTNQLFNLLTSLNSFTIEKGEAISSL